MPSSRCPSVSPRHRPLERKPRPAMSAMWQLGKVGMSIALLSDGHANERKCRQPCSMSRNKVTLPPAPATTMPESDSGQ